MADQAEEARQFAQKIYNQAESDGAAPEVLDALRDMQSDVLTASASQDPNAAFLAWLRPMFAAADAYGADITGEFAENSAQDGRGIVLIARITNQQLAVLRGVSKTTGRSYERALGAVIESFVARRAPPTK